jgi:methionyl-tRNA formyltransferase
LILQKKAAIGPDDTLGSVYFNHLFPLGVEAMLEAADLVVAGRHTQTVQDESQASYEGWCRDGEARIDWHRHLDHIYDLIRGCDPAPGAWAMIAGRKVRVFDARKHAVRRFEDVQGKPGVIAAIGEQSVEIVAQGGLLEISRMRADGGPKSSAADLLRSFGLSKGDIIA